MKVLLLLLILLVDRILFVPGISSVSPVGLTLTFRAVARRSTAFGCKLPELRRLGCPKLRPSRKWTPEYCATKVAATDSKDLASGAQALMTMISCLDKPESSRSNSTLIGSDNSMLPSRVLSSFHQRRRLDTYDNIDSPFCRAKEPGFCPALKSSRASSLARGNTTSRSLLTNFRSPPGCVSTSTPMSRASSKASSQVLLTPSAPSQF